LIDDIIHFRASDCISSRKCVSRINCAHVFISVK